MRIQTAITNTGGHDFILFDLVAATQLHGLPCRAIITQYVSTFLTNEIFQASASGFTPNKLNTLPIANGDPPYTFTPTLVNRYFGLDDFNPGGSSLDFDFTIEVDNGGGWEAADPTGVVAEYWDFNTYIADAGGDIEITGASAACFWTDIVRSIQDCGVTETITVFADNGNLVDGDINPTPPGFVPGGIFTILLDGGGGEFDYVWIGANSRYEPTTFVGAHDNAPGTMTQGLNSWPCRYYNALS